MNPSLKSKIVITGVFMLILGYASSVDATSRSSDSAYRTETFTVQPGGVLNVNTSGGSIEVVGGNQNRVVVKMYVRRNGRILTPRDTDLSNFTISIEQRGNEITASAQFNRQRTNILTGGGNNESISFVVEVPQNFNTNLNTSGGSLKLENLVGQSKGRTSGGSITLSRFTGESELGTSGGSINISNSEGSIRARTSGGSVRATNTKGNLELSTSGGSMVLENLAGTVKASTSGGSIRANLLEVNGEVSLSTSGGSITASLPQNLGLDVDIRGTRVHMPLQNFSGNSQPDRIQGTMNGGGYPISMRTSGGSIRISFD